MHVKAEMIIIERTMVTIGSWKLCIARGYKIGYCSANNMLFLDFGGDFIIVLQIITELNFFVGGGYNFMYVCFTIKRLTNLLTCCCMYH